MGSNPVSCFGSKKMKPVFNYKKFYLYVAFDNRKFTDKDLENIVGRYAEDGFVIDFSQSFTFCFDISEEDKLKEILGNLNKDMSVMTSVDIEFVNGDETLVLTEVQYDISNEKLNLNDLASALVENC